MAFIISHCLLWWCPIWVPVPIPVVPLLILLPASAPSGRWLECLGFCTHTGVLGEVPASYLAQVWPLWSFGE